MLLKEVLVNLAGSAVTSLNPIVGTSIVTAYRVVTADSDDSNVADEVTGEALLKAIEALPEEKREALLKQDLSKEIQLSEERIAEGMTRTEVKKLMVDSATANKIAILSGKVVTYGVGAYLAVILLVSVLQAIGVIFLDADVTRLENASNFLPSWESLLAILSVPGFIVVSFFGFNILDFSLFSRTTAGGGDSKVAEKLKDFIKGVKG